MPIPSLEEQIAHSLNGTCCAESKPCAYHLALYIRDWEDGRDCHLTDDDFDSLVDLLEKSGVGQ